MRRQRPAGTGGLLIMGKRLQPANAAIEAGSQKKTCR